jgi:HEAT repeat protein
MPRTGFVWLFFGGILCSAMMGQTTTTTTSAPASQPSAKARELLPEIDEVLSSTDHNRLFGFIAELLNEPSRPSGIGTSLRYDLPSSDYELILKQALAVIDPERLAEENKLKFVVIIMIITKQHDLHIPETLLRKWLDKRDQHVRMAALRIIGATHSTQLAPDVAKLISDKVFQKLVLETLIELRSPLATPYLVSDLQGPKFGCIKALRNLSQLKDVQAGPDVVKLLDTEDNQIQIWAIRTLVDIDYRKAAPGFIGIIETVPSSLTDKNIDTEKENLAVEAAIALAKWEEPRGLSFVIDYLRSPNGLRRMFMREAVVRAHLISIVPSIEKTLGANESVDNNTRMDLLRLLRELNAKDSIPTLRKIAADRTDRHLASVAAEQLGRMRVAEATPDVLWLMEQSDTSAEARIALARMGQSAGIEAILKNEGDPFLEMSYASAPEVMTRLNAEKLSNLVKTTQNKSLSEIFKNGGISIVFDDDAKEITSRMISEPNITGRQALQQLIDSLNFSESLYTAYIDVSGTIHICEYARARAFWEDWLRQNR